MEASLLIRVSRSRFLLATAILIMSSMLLGGCGRSVVYIDAVRGNYAYQQGRYQDATVSYLRALDTETFTEGFSYNLGNVYHALGEPDAALAMWERAAAAEDPEIRFRLLFNRGNLYYELGRYRDAYDEFRRALEIDSTALDAKINLELSLLKIQAFGMAPEAAAEGQQTDRQENRETERMLEYVRRKEGHRWSAAQPQPQPETFDVEDW